MNKHLQNISDLIQQDKNLSAEQKVAVLKSLKDADKELEITTFKLDRTEKVKRTTAILLEETIEELEQKRKAVEAQNRELAIESSLEKVRAQALGMHKPADLLDVCKVVFKELSALGVQELRNAIIHTFHDDGKYFMDYDYSDFLQGSVTKIPYDGHFIVDRYMKEIKSSDNAFSHNVVQGADLEEWKKYRRTGGQPDDPRLDTITLLCYYVYSTGSASIGISTFGAISEGTKELLKRFRNVFDLSYKRYIDITNAEAQAKEAQIQLALERVRARTMAMHQSDELADTASILFQQIKELGFETWSCGFCTWTKNDLAEVWMAADSGGLLPPMLIPYKEEPTHADIYMASLRGEPAHDKIWEGKGLENHYAFLKTIPSVKAAIDILEKSGLTLPSRQCYYVGFFKEGYLLLITIEPNEVLKELSKRFASVFDLTYTRFLDLQKAEAQSRESQVQLALERVRARTMAMQHSDELADASFVLDSQVRSLGIKTRGCAFNIYGNNESLEWFSSEHGPLPMYKTPRENLFLRYFEKGLSGIPLYVEEFAGAVCAEHYEYLCTIPVMGDALRAMIAAGGSFPTRQIDHVTYHKYGYLLFITLEPEPEAHEIFIRFGKVFEQTYTRFLDLQKAEAQARESQIEASLERVRSRSMAMQKSEELKDVIQIVYEQFVHLNINIEHTGFVIDYKVRNDYNIWIADPLGVPSQIIVPYFDSVYYNRFNEAKEKGEDFFATNLSFEEKNRFYEKLFEYIPGLPEEARKFYFGCPALSASTVLLDNVCLYIENFSGIPYSDEENATLLRFGKVFQQTYTRFLDLQRAEAQAMEATKRASVDRIRAEIASMRTTNDLERITPLIWNELTTLGVPFIRCGVFIMNEETQQVQTFLYTEGKTIASFTSAFSNAELITEALPYWRRKEIYKTHWDEAAFLKQAKSLVEQGAVTDSEKYLTEHRPTDLYLHLLPFLQGMLYVGDAASLNEEHLQLVQALADAFSTAYARYEDFNKLEAAKKQVDSTLNELQATQKQLIQSEKMASLGELTAGIAHEIQNPLNFVNNFSEVSKELIEELETERSKVKSERDETMEEEILNDIKQNLEKINHHGKRADAIVKGMLQHSRSTGNVKEPTDINALADEYLRLAYHGLRAKDPRDAAHKAFNATLQTDYDKSISKINIIPQDIGRVILNVITNAFYAIASPPSKGGISDSDKSYNPTVWLSTKKVGDKVLISVKDNGSGIPKKIVDKIFQPFFTTKPTGQGTGLGLSLSYDIVKAHGGELKVETKEGEETTFIIILPILNS